MQLKVHIEYQPQFRGTAIYLHGVDKNGQKFVIEPVKLVVRTYEKGEAINEPTFLFYGDDGEQFLQSLVQALVQIGFKPDEIKASDKQLEATKYHLEDMRKLVFEKK